MSKTYTGGYRLVSLAFVDLALAVTAVAVAGLGDALGVKSRKRIVLTDIVVSGEKKNDVTVQVKKDGNNYIIEDVYGYDLEIVTSGSTLKATQHADHITASEIDSGSATAGQVLTADGSGGVAFANPAGGGTKLYKHTITGFTGGGGSFQIPFEMVTSSNTPFASLNDVIQASPNALSISFFGDKIIGILDGSSEQDGEILFLYAFWDSTATPSFKVAYRSYTKTSITITDTVTEL